MKPLVVLCLISFAMATLASVCYKLKKTQHFTWASSGHYCGYYHTRNNYRYCYTYSKVKECCGGWAGSVDSGCNQALCDGKTNPHACNRNEGNVKVSASGPTYTSSGGTCFQPNQCTDCNRGYYADNAYCRACTEIANCHYPSCTSSTNSLCQYCKGVIKDDSTQYGWWAYTRWVDGGKSCKLACSWREGSRCYPGSCSDTTVASCTCLSGFGGKDCAQIIEKPVILGSFVQFEHVGDTTIELVEAPVNISAPSPQDTVFTNNVNLQTADAYVDAQYVKKLPPTPPNFYVKHEDSFVGIVNGGVSLKLIRGLTTPSQLSWSCPEDHPMPNNYRCNKTFSLTEEWSTLTPFQHADRIEFTTFATNGGYITVYDRENGDREVRYTLQGATRTYTFGIGIDTEIPEHCLLSSPSCDDAPLSLQDVSFKASILVQWKGWYDPLAGIDSYHFEVFHLRSTGTEESSELEHGDKVADVIPSSVPADVSQTTLQLSTPGPYSVTIATFDKAGNHRTARRIMIFDDQSIVDKQGSRTTKEDDDGLCVWKEEPAAPIIANANPNANCDWIIEVGPVQLTWKNYFINTRHHAGHWLHAVNALDHIEPSLDDYEGLRTVEQVNNVLGIVEFQVSYDVIFEDQTEQIPWYNISDIQVQATTIDQELQDGMGLNITLRALDITGTYADENIFVKVDTSPPVITNLWLTLGDMKNVSVHKAEDLALLTIEWEMYDTESGIHDVQWRIYDNYTGEEFIHGTAFESPQGNTESLQQCTHEYMSYPRGADCYCTPFDGCFHRHVQVKPIIDNDGTTGLNASRHVGTHDYDYFIEVKTINHAMLTTTLVKKITIDVSPPVVGTVHEGHSGSPEVDYQQDRLVHVHWKDFFDKESGVLFYDYIYGTTCYEESAFAVDLTDTDQHKRTYLDFASFTVIDEGTFFVTVVAYNRALDPSRPVCSDGITVDSSIPSVSNVNIRGVITDPGPIATDDDNIWYIHADRQVQLLENPDESCKNNAFYMSASELSVYPLKYDSQGRRMNLTKLDCHEIEPRSKLISYTTFLDRIELEWSMDSKVPLHDTEIGLASPESDEPDIAEFESAYHHTEKHIVHLDILDGQMFYILIKTTSKSGVINIQKVGPFLADNSPPIFEGEVSITSNTNDNDLIVNWGQDAFIDVHNVGTLKYQYSMGSQPRGTDVLGYRDLEFNDKCVQSESPTCTVVNVPEQDWELHHLHDYYVTIKVTNRVGLSVTAVSPRYTRDGSKPIKGVVLDSDGKDTNHQRHDDAFQLSTSELKGEWFGFVSSHSNPSYTICQAKDNIITVSICKDVGKNTSGTLAGLNLEYFTVYQLAVIASTPGGTTTVFSDGIMPVNVDRHLDDMSLYDGTACNDEADMQLEKYSHHTQIDPTGCQDDLSYQRSIGILSSYWTVPDSFVQFTPDLYWTIQQRAPIEEHWENITEEAHLPSSVSKLSTALVLESGRMYRYMLTFCAAEHCFPSLYTDGVTVIHYPPQTGSLDVLYEYTDTGTMVKVTFDTFLDPDIEDLSEARAAMNHYEWNIVDNDHAGRTINTWTYVSDMNEIDDKQASFEVQLEDRLTFNKCWRFSIRGYNKAGLYSTISKDINNCMDALTVKEPTVIDCVGPSTQLEDGSLYGESITYVRNSLWSDKDYTPHNNIISAVWPTLRYPKYSYVVLELVSVESILFYNEVSSLDIRNPCSVPDYIACGVTDENFINVRSNFEHGKRYTICIHANATTLEFEKWTEDEMLPELNVCSDGITVDTTSPIPGNVYINGPNALYQQSLTDIYVVWESFIDVEDLSNAPHSTGITHYEVALGTHEGGNDVHDFVNANIANHYIFNDLNLQNGYRYYATIKGYDFTGRSSVAYSAPITTDTTPPSLSNESISMGERYISDRNGINICWKGLFSDSESGMLLYEYAVGSRQGYDDIHVYAETTLLCADIKPELMDSLEEGHVYFISVRGTNGAGLSTTTSSWAVIVDFSPPIAGSVFDGLKAGGKDIDFQTEPHVLSAFWNGFHDPHTNIDEYYVEVGTRRGMDDIIERQSVGTREDVVFDHMHLTEGQTYYFTVTACNTAGLCTTVTSDGLVIDSSAPVPGVVKDGTSVEGIEYQSSRTYIACKWYNFVDAQSGISHFTWRLGTEIGIDDIVATREVHSADEIVIPDLRDLNLNLPIIKQRLYSTVRAYNKAGSWSESTSLGFEVDASSPVFAQPLTHVSIGSLRTSTSILTNMLKVSWEVEDLQSFISKQYISMVPHVGEDFNVSVQIAGLVRDYTFTDITLHDGSVYDVILWSCNGANLCSTSSITELLVDSSVPIAGTFAIHTDHAAAIHRHREWMTWSMDSVTLAILGFSDEHSGILGYHINIGSTYMGAELTLDSTGPVYVPHDEDAVHLSDDRGSVQIFTIQTNDLSAYQHIFVTVWAENGVGLTSEVVHSQFKLVPGGFMELVRRCSHYSCQGHCVCSAQNQKCPTDSNTRPCYDASEDISYASLRVADYIDMEDTSGTIQYTPTDMMLAARWEVLEADKLQPKWYEWSAGITEETDPQGIFTNTERVWHDAGRRMSVTFPLKSGNTLHENEKYSIFVRAWYNGTTFATFTSPGVKVNSIKPQITDLFGKSVKEVETNGNTDVDVSNTTQPLFIDWTGSFKDTFGMLSKYSVFISATAGGHGHIQHKDVQVPTSHVTIPVSELIPGRRYYSSVQGHTYSGLHAFTVSDGFLIDTDRPNKGMILDGTGHLDLKYQNQSFMISVHWRGFTDIQSSVVSYTWCVSSANKIGQCDIVPSKKLGMETFVSMPPQIEISNGEMVVSEVFVTDAAGYTSYRAVSNGVIIDTTAPICVHQQSDENNLLSNPSFEEAEDPLELTDLRLSRACSNVELPSWNKAGCITAVTGKVKKGYTAVCVRGKISQVIQGLTKGNTYSLTFHVTHVPSMDNIAFAEEVLVRFGDERHIFKLHTRPGHSGRDSNAQWQLISATFQSTHSSEVITIGTLPRSNGVLLDDIVLTEMSDVSGDVTGQIKVHAVLVHDFSSIHASWKCIDSESGIRDYIWAIGTVRGGTQYQDFTNVGQRHFDTNSKLVLPHNTVLYITVVATNGADLKTVFYSDPLLIDRTPPTIAVVNDGQIAGEDVDFHGHRDISFTFDISDGESGIQECSWTLGTLDNYNSVFDYRKLESGSRSGSTTIPEDVDISRPFYVTVECINTVGLISEKRSDGVQLILTPPDTSNVVLEILGLSDTQYPTMDLYQGRPDELRVQWSGFKPTDRIDFYKVEVVGDSFKKSLEVSDAGTASAFVQMLDLPVDQGSYSCILTGVNEIGIDSVPIFKNFTVINEEPDLKDTAGVSMTWNPLTEVVRVDWSDVFSSTYDLYYEISVGTLAAYSTDVVMWQETISTHIDFTMTKEDIGEFGKQIYVVVTAISPSGTYTTFSTSHVLTAVSQP